MQPLTYSCDKELKILQFVKVEVAKTQNNLGLVLKKIQESEITFDLSKMKNISYSLNQYLPKAYFEVAQFISRFYFAQLFAVLKNFYSFDFRQENRILKIELQKKIKLSEEQNRALNELKKHKISLLFGDTGSGKTHIYKQLIYEKIQQNQKVIFLVPEISLAPQIEQRLKSVFGEIVGSWHSKMTPKLKAEVLEKIKTDEIKIVVGPRSALFLPLLNLGLIIVDEEHSESYISTTSPNFHVRDIAIYLGQKLGINVVLGSATPSLRSYHKFNPVRLEGNFFQSKREIIFEKGNGTFSENILEQIYQRVLEKEQVIVFIPIRGNFKQLICKECRTIIECPNCSVGMSLYHDENKLKCQYCDHTQEISRSCQSCGSQNLESQKIGTIEAVNELKSYFKSKKTKTKIERFDSNSITTLNKLNKVLGEFSEHKIDILVGTHMLSKGHDYPNVTLTVILGLDQSLNQAEFSAFEKNISLMVQLAGRTGRHKNGTVLIQTNRENNIKKYISNYEQFLKNELENRENLYPPFVNMPRFLITHTKKETGEEILKKIVSILDEVNLDINFEIFTYGEAPIFRLFGKYRFNIIFRISKIKDIFLLSDFVLEKLSDSEKKQLKIEINPQNFA